MTIKYILTYLYGFLLHYTAFLHIYIDIFFSLSRLWMCWNTFGSPELISIGSSWILWTPVTSIIRSWPPCQLWKTTSPGIKLDWGHTSLRMTLGSDYPGSGIPKKYENLVN